jgi:hypothetical protein
VPNWRVYSIAPCGGLWLGKKKRPLELFLATPRHIVAHSGQSSQLFADAPAEMLDNLQQLREVVIGGPKIVPLGSKLTTRREDL